MVIEANSEFGKEVVGALEKEIATGVSLAMPDARAREGTWALDMSVPNPDGGILPKVMAAVDVAGVVRLVASDYEAVPVPLNGIRLAVITYLAPRELELYRSSGGQRACGEPGGAVYAWPVQPT